MSEDSVRLTIYGAEVAFLKVQRKLNRKGEEEKIIREKKVEKNKCGQPIKRQAWLDLKCLPVFQGQSSISADIRGKSNS